MSPHDALFKLAFENISACVDLVRAAVPPEVLEAIDLDTLTVEKGSFVKKDLSERFSDLLCSVRAHGSPVLLHFLFEHKSKAERFTVLDLFDNAAAIWKSWRAKYPEVESLPRIVPIVLHHGPKPWNQPRELRGLLAGDDALARSFAALDPSFPIVFFDLGGATSDRTIDAFADPLARLAIFMLMVSRTRDFLHQLERRGFELLRVVWLGPGGKERATPVLKYVVRFLPASVDPEEFAEMISENVAPDAEETMRTLRDVWIEEGLVKGKAEGKAEGKVQGEADATLRVLQVRFGPAAESLRSRIEAIRDSGSLLRLIGFAATAESLEAFARELRDG